MSAYGLAERTGLSREEAGEFIRRYFERYARVREFFDELIAQAGSRGYVETILGRRRYFPELREGARVDRNARWRAEREAVNAPIQGSAADIMKLAMIRLHSELQARGGRSAMILQVHDELLLEVPLDELESVAALTRATMEGALEMTVPLAVDLSAGPSWLDLQRLNRAPAAGV
jgi:DNA polymerase-1